MRPLDNWFGHDVQIAYNHRGQGMFEMMLVLPFLLIFFFGVIELSHLANTHHRVSTLSREAADAAFKTCVRDTIVPGSYTGCLDGVRAQIDAYAASTLSDFDTEGAVILSLYGYNPATLALEQFGISGDGTNGFNTHYNAGNIDASLLAKGHEVLAYGEIFYKNDWHTPLGRLLTFIIPKEIYEVCIF